MESSQKKLKLIQEDKCDNCGAPLIRYSNFYRCEYCGSRYQLIDDNGNIYPVIVEAIEEIKPQTQLPQDKVDNIFIKCVDTLFLGIICLIKLFTSIYKYIIIKEFNKKIVNFLLWFFSAIFIISGIGNLSTVVLTGILLIFVGLFINPAVQDFLYSKNIKLTSGQKWLIVIIILAINIFIVPKNVSKNNEINKTKINSETPMKNIPIKK